MDLPNELLPGIDQPSSFTPVPLETLDWDEIHAEMHEIELKLARIKLDFLDLFPVLTAP